MVIAADMTGQEEQLLQAVQQAPPEEAAALSKKWLEFCKVLERHRGEKILVVLTGYPDPDSIASGLAHKFLAKAFDFDTTLLCFHEVSHQENRALVKRLEVDLQLYNEQFDLQPYSACAFLDTQKIDTPITDKLAEKTLLSFVDHHKRLGEQLAEFVDIREDVASTCAIYTEYLRAYAPRG